MREDLPGQSESFKVVWHASLNNFIFSLNLYGRQNFKNNT